MSLEVDIRHTAGRFRLDVQMRLGPGLTALLGPSGSGKTTVLNVIAGVLRPEQGRVRIDDEVVVDTAAGVWRPAYRRSIGYVFQEPRLFPHLTVRQNLMFARWFRHHGPTSRSPEEVIDLLNLGGLLGRYPSRLSGGEKQRVALGRALLSMPRLLLLDEPLAAVDQQHRDVILPYLDRLRAALAIPAVYVTHTWSEVTGRADHVVELGEGRVVFSGPVSAHAERGQQKTGGQRRDEAP
jgi:molybdate transport system ATP-binding protein